MTHDEPLVHDRCLPRAKHLAHDPGLAQSVPRFAKDGGIKFFLAPDLDPKAELKFDAQTPDGVGGQIKPLHPLGSGAFKKVETGKTDSFSLVLDDVARDALPGVVNSAWSSSRRMQRWLRLILGRMKRARTRTPS